MLERICVRWPTVSWPFVRSTSPATDTLEDFMAAIGHEQLVTACSPGGASVLTSRTELRAAAGQLAGVAPARFVDGNRGVYAFETRFDGDVPVSAVVLDSKGSALNRVEAALSQGIRDGHPLLSLTPRMTLSYEGLDPLTDLDVPHRFTDGHFRAGSIEGVPATDHARYRAARDAHPGNARALLETAPSGLVFGAWDSTRRANQARYRSALVGEVIGILADQSPEGRAIPSRGAARSDQIAPSVRLSGPEMERVLEAQERELSLRNAENIRKEIARGKRERVSASALGLGSIPPSMDGLGFVSCRQILRHHVLSFAALRQLRFGLGPEGDATARALLAALALNGLARADAELLLRANCDLVEAGPTVVDLDARHGQSTQLDSLTIHEADALLGQAIDAATVAGVRWEGQTLDVIGDPMIAGAIVADADE
jgi:CRISPR-associated protein Csb1